MYRQRIESWTELTSNIKLFPGQTFEVDKVQLFIDIACTCNVTVTERRKMKNQNVKNIFSVERLGLTRSDPSGKHS